MSSCASGSCRSWLQYDDVRMMRCPDCPRRAPLKRLVSREDKNGNFGREFLKCESKLEVEGKEKIQKKCWHFEWMDEYIEQLQAEGLIDLCAGATLEFNLPSADEKLGVPTVGGPTVGDAELKRELKKLNKHLKQMIDLKKQATLIGAIFYFSIVVLGVVYLLISSRYRVAIRVV